MKNIFWILFAILCCSISLYPLLYILVDWQTLIKYGGFLSTKESTLIYSFIWKTGFYGHIIFGGIALVVGWTQFSQEWRAKYMIAHRKVGKIYTISALISGVCGVGIGFYATGGIISQTGFVALGLIWLLTTSYSYKEIKAARVKQHEILMIYSYAACFAAVTLRLWLPLLSLVFGEFLMAYKIVAWLCWIPNMIVAYFVVRRKMTHSSLELTA